MEIIPNAFQKLGLRPDASKQEILANVIDAMKREPSRMKEWANSQSLLLNEETHFIIKFLYYPKFDVVEI